MVAKLLDLEADKFMAAEYAEATSDLDQIRSLFQSGNPVRGHRLGYEKLKAVSELLDAVDSGIRAAKYARWEAERSMGEAEKVEAAQWAPEEKKKSNEFYLAGSRALREYDLEGAQENYGKARDTAKACIALAAEREARANERVKRQAEEMMMDLMKVIESASELTIVTADGTVVSPKKWSGEHTLKELEEEQPPVDSAGSDNQSLRIPSGEGTVVLGETSEETLLAQARELWKLGAIEKNKGNADGAIEHFREASRYVEAYKRLAVAHVYTVRLNTAQRECLWRIAEQRSIFDNPRLWPILWRRNRNLIAAPDLILPGKKLVIPALPSDKVELRRSCSRARRLYTTPHRRDPPISPEAVKSPPTT
jgi:tetratricopeptide (TPR) repeat protein